MKLSLTALSLFALLSVLSVDAREISTNDQFKNQSFWNPVVINNLTSERLTYRIGSFGEAYHVMPYSSDTYHSVFTSNQSIWINTNFKLEGALASGSRYLPNHYNIEKVAAINVKSFFDVQVVCLDGSTTSCIENSVTEK